MIKAPLPFDRSKRMFYQCLPSLVCVPALFDTPSIGLNICCELATLYDFTIGLCCSTLIAYRAILTRFGFILLEVVVSAFVPCPIADKDIILRTDIAIGILIILKVLCIVNRIWSLTGTTYRWYGHQCIDP